MAFGVSLLCSMNAIGDTTLLLKSLQWHLILFPQGKATFLNRAQRVGPVWPLPTLPRISYLSSAKLPVSPYGRSPYLCAPLMLFSQCLSCLFPWTTHTDFSHGHQLLQVPGISPHSSVEAGVSIPSHLQCRTIAQHLKQSINYRTV